MIFSRGILWYQINSKSRHLPRLASARHQRRIPAACGLLARLGAADGSAAGAAMGERRGRGGRGRRVPG